MKITLSGGSRIRLAPIDLTAARAWVERVHVHLAAPIGGRVAVSVERLVEEGRWARCCVAILGRPVSRVMQAQGCAEIIRVASDRTPHAASKAIAALTRAAIALGYRRLVSSTRLGEAGTSYLAAGWRPVHLDARERDWCRNDGTRAVAEQPGPKVRWEAGPDAMPADPEVVTAVKAAVAAGRELPGRRERRMPLFERVVDRG